MSFNQDSFSTLFTAIDTSMNGMPERSSTHCNVGAYLATGYAESIYPKNTQSNGLGDAFRHAFWSSYMCFNKYCNDFDKNLNMSKRVTDKYEELTKSFGISLEMDILNNQKGRELAKSLKDIGMQYIAGSSESRSEFTNILKSRIIDGIAKGDFYHIVNDRIERTNIVYGEVGKATGKVIANGEFVDLLNFPPQKIEDLRGNCRLAEGFLFYCDRPEPVKLEDLADSGKWLNKADLNKGHGQVYSWHKNETGRDIKSCLLIYNPNSYKVTINVNRYSLTDIADGPDTKAWEEYLKGTNSKTIEIQPYSFGNLFLRVIKENRIFGTIAELSIIKTGTQEYSDISLFDLAYIEDRYSGNATTYATSDSKHLRGVGNSYKTILTPSMIEISSSAKAIEIGNILSSFIEKELVSITDGLTNIPSKLLGCFGQQIDISLIVKNTSGQSGNFKIFMGSKGGPSHPVFKLSDGTVYHQNWVSTDGTQRARDLIEIGTINNGDSKMINFSFAVSGMGSAPFVIGVRKA